MGRTLFWVACGHQIVCTMIWWQSRDHLHTKYLTSLSRKTFAFQKLMMPLLKMSTPFFNIMLMHMIFFKHVEYCTTIQNLSWDQKSSSWTIKEPHKLKSIWAICKFEMHRQHRSIIEIRSTTYTKEVEPVSTYLNCRCWQVFTWPRDDTCRRAVDVSTYERSYYDTSLQETSLAATPKNRS